MTVSSVPIAENHKKETLYNTKTPSLKQGKISV